MTTARTGLPFPRMPQGRQRGRIPYTIIKVAIERKHPLSGKYEHYVRHFSPHALGDDREGRRSVLGFQYGGGRRGRLPPDGEWRFFLVEKLV
jgi:hypothetical protein